MNTLQAYNIVIKEKPESTIQYMYTLPDRFVFKVTPKGQNPDTFICAATYVYKKDGSIGYGYPTAEEMKNADYSK